MAVALQRVNTKDHALGSALASLAQGSAVAPSGPPPESEVITASRVIPARDAAYGAFPRVIDERLLSVLSKGGIERPYSHQSEAISHAIEGRHVVVVTPTASGKTLCYNVPVLSTILDQPTARALYLFPTKALAQDQLAELHTLSEGLQRHGEEIGVFTYDGDTPQPARRAIRGRAHIVLSNPEMLHSGILPHHPRWAKLFENLRFVVIDELHAYRGVFGSHLANVLRRLSRVCPPLRLRSRLRLFLGDDRQPSRARRGVDGQALLAGRSEWGTPRREVVPHGEPPGGEPATGDPSVVCVTDTSAGTRVSPPSAPDHRLRTEPTDNRDS